MIPCLSRPVISNVSKGSLRFERGGSHEIEDQILPSPGSHLRVNYLSVIGCDNM